MESRYPEGALLRPAIPRRHRSVCSGCGSTSAFKGWACYGADSTSTLRNSVEFLDQGFGCAKDRISPSDDLRMLVAPLRIGSVQHVRIPQRVSLRYDRIW